MSGPSRRSSCLSPDLGLASSASPAAKEAAISALLGPGTPVALAGNAIGSLFRQLAAAAGIDSSLQPRLALRSARLTDLEAVQAAPSSPGGGMDESGRLRKLILK